MICLRFKTSYPCLKYAVFNEINMSIINIEIPTSNEYFSNV